MSNMTKFLTFVIAMSILLSCMYAMEKETNQDRNKCTEIGGSFIRLSGEFHCVSKNVFLNIKGLQNAN